jgi:hypothetical protein
MPGLEHGNAVYRLLGNIEIGVKSFERARLKAAPYVVFRDYGTAGKPCPFKTPMPRVFPKPI